MCLECQCKAEMREIKISSRSSTSVSKWFSPAQSYSPDAGKPFLSVLSCLIAGSDSLSLELPVALWASSKKAQRVWRGKKHCSATSRPKQWEQENRHGETTRHTLFISNLLALHIKYSFLPAVDCLASNIICHRHFQEKLLGPGGFCFQDFSSL